MKYSDDIVAERIRQRRIELGMTQGELAKKCGYKGRSAINKLEVDARNVQIERLVQIADALEVSPDYLIGWEDEMTEREKKISEINRMYELLTPEQQNLVNDLIRNFVLSRERKE